MKTGSAGAAQAEYVRTKLLMSFQGFYNQLHYERNWCFMKEQEPVKRGRGGARKVRECQESACVAGAAKKALIAEAQQMAKFTWNR